MDVRELSRRARAAACYMEACAAKRGADQHHFWNWNWGGAGQTRP